MLYRTDSSTEKERFTVYLPKSLTKAIRVRSAETERTLSKYIADLVEADGRVGSLDMEKLRYIITDISCGGLLDVAGMDNYTDKILSIFGIEQAGD
jgi:hypothetical protein